jgi:hypothetical protein
MDVAKSARRSLRYPFIGFAIAWFLVLAAIYSDLFEAIGFYDSRGEYVGPEPQVKISTYLLLAAVVTFASFAVVGQRLALKLRATDAEDPLAKAAHRFNNLAVIVGLVAGAVYAIGTFLTAFDNFTSRDASGLVRFFGVYMPIIAATVVVVATLLVAFVFRKDTPGMPETEVASERSKLQRSIGLAYAIPVIGTAIAIIFGLVVYDITQTTLTVWVWVIIQAIIAVSILLGTRFAAAARLARPRPPKPRNFAAAAINLNLVLSIVFGVVVAIMAFTYGASAVSELAVWPERQPDQNEIMYRTVGALDLQWLLQDFAPALLLLALAEIGVYRMILVRHTAKIAE